MNTIPVSKLISEGNVRAEKTNKKTLEYKALKSNIAKVGMLTPITYRKNDDGAYVIINGHQRVEIAKDLKLQEIPAYESNGQIDDITKQVSTNMFTVPMTHLDASYAIDQLVEQGAITTRKALSSHFGKSIAWVDSALAICNLHPFIRHTIKDKYSNDWSDHLISISKSPIKNQEIAMKTLLSLKTGDWIKENVKSEILDYYHQDDNVEDFLYDLSRELQTDETKWKYICDVVGEKTFRACEEKADMTPVYENVLFQEFAKEQFCDNEEFLQEVFLSETAIGQYLNDCPVLNDDNRDSISFGETICFDFANKVSTLKSNIKKETGVPFSNVIIQAWNGNVFNSKLYVTIVETAVTEDVKDDEYYEEKAEEKDPHALKYNKFNKWAAPIIVKYVESNVDTNTRDKKDNRIVLNWLIHDLSACLEIDKPFHVETFKSHPIVTSKTDEELFNGMTKEWFSEHWQYADFAQIDTLLSKLGLKSCIEIVTDEFNANNEETRKGYFNIFSKDELAEFSGQSKSETKQIHLTCTYFKEFKDIPYIDLVCTNKGSGSNSIRQY